MDSVEAKAVGILNQQKDGEMPLPDLDKEIGDEARTAVVEAVKESDRIELEPVVKENLAYHIARLKPSKRYYR